MANMPTETTLLADQLERALRGGAWHGPALLELLDGLGPEEAAFRPAPGRNAILGHVEHLAFWLGETALRLEGAPVDPAREEPDWNREEDSARRWTEALERLESNHRRLRDAVRALEAGALDRVPAGAESDLRAMLLGTLQHLAYHGGQIGLLRKLAPARAGGRP